MYSDKPMAHHYRRSLTMFLLIIVLLILPVHMSAQSEVLDRMVAVVDNRIITLGDMRTEKAVRDVLGEPSPQDDRELLNELIDECLIRAQLEQYALTEPTEADVDDEFSQIKDLKGLPPETVREAVRDHLRVQRFFAERFGRVITTTDTELQKYYDEVFIPAARARGATSIPPLAAVMQDVRANVFQQKLAAEAKLWLDRAKRTAKIQIFN